jgi:tryptophan 2,3-dioxygenase
MVDGMDKDEFLKFRMSLLPASGFQSGQYRTIELMSTDTYNLVHFTERPNIQPDAPKEALYNVLYWKRGATELATGQKTLTLRQFEGKYSVHFIQTAEKYASCNLWQLYQKLSAEEQQDPELIAAYQELDLNANVRWNLSHYRSAVRHLERKPADIAATGGTNWQQYLPPKNQRIIFFPGLWTDEELDNWGKSM